MRFWGSFLLVVILDRISKTWVLASFLLGESRIIVEGGLYLTYVQNRGAAFGLMPGKSWLFFISALLVIMALVIYNWRSKASPLEALSTGLIAGGALGNLIDRYFYGFVIDFIDLGWWPVFNLADSAIVCGGLLLLILVLLDGKREERNA